MGDVDVALFDAYTLLNFAVFHMSGVVHHLIHFKRHGRGPPLLLGVRLALFVAVAFEIYEICQGDGFNKGGAVLHVIGDVFASVTGYILAVTLWGGTTACIMVAYMALIVQYQLFANWYVFGSAGALVDTWVCDKLYWQPYDTLRGLDRQDAIKYTLAIWPK